MRISPAGSPGKFACDACDKPQSKGVYTGHPEFPHLCSRCLKATPQAIAGP
jgi:hypothetical protein